jgi:hypothetical protein
MHFDDPHQKDPGRGYQPELSKADLPLEELDLGKMDFAPGEILLVPDPGMVIPLGRYCLVDFIDGSLVKRIPAPYDDTVTLLDLSELGSLVNRLDTASLPLLGGAATKEIYPPAWAQSIDDINLAFEEGQDPLAQSPFEEVALCSRSEAAGADYTHYAVKLGRFVESIRELHEYMDYQRSLGGESEHRADIDRLDMFLSQAMGRAYARSTKVS